MPNEAQIDNPGFREVLASKKAVIGNFNAGPVSNVPGIAVRMPVIRDGELRYVLEFVLEPMALAKLMKAQGYSGTWYVGLADRNGRFISRLPAPPAGNHVSADFQAAIARTPEGWYRGRTLEGQDTYTAHKTSRADGLDGWCSDSQQ